MSQKIENETVYERIRREAEEQAAAKNAGRPLDERLNMVPVKGPNGEKSLEERLNMRL